MPKLYFAAGSAIGAETKIKGGIAMKSATQEQKPKPPTLRQVRQLLDIIDQQGKSRQYVQDLIQSGLLPDLLKAPDLSSIDRRNFRRLIGVRDFSILPPVFTLAGSKWPASKSMRDIMAAIQAKKYPEFWLQHGPYILHGNNVRFPDFIPLRSGEYYLAEFDNPIGEITRDVAIALLQEAGFAVATVFEFLALLLFERDADLPQYCKAIALDSYFTETDGERILTLDHGGCLSLLQMSGVTLTGAFPPHILVTPIP